MFRIWRNKSTNFQTQLLLELQAENKYLGIVNRTVSHSQHTYGGYLANV